MKHSLTKIIWRDAFSRDGWSEIKDLKEIMERDVEMQTVGFFMCENEDWIAVAATIDLQEKAADIWFIPKKWIIKRITLEK